MIKIEHAVFASPEQMMFIIEGMRNPMNSWDKIDSGYRCVCNNKAICDSDCPGDSLCPRNGEFKLGDNDISLMNRLAKAGTDHRKFMRMMPVYVRITAPLYWWKEFDTYKVGTVANSCSTMHKIQAKEFTLEDFSMEHLQDRECIAKDRFLEVPYDDLYSPIDSLVDTINMLNTWRSIYLKEGKQKTSWWQMIQSLPSSYNQTRNVMLNYEVLANIYHSRKNHKLDEWRDFCSWIESIPYSYLVTQEEDIEW